MNTVRTSSGIEMPCEYFNPNEATKQIHIRIHGTDLARIASVFSDRSETEMLWWGDSYAANFTNLLAIVPEAGMVRVVLGKE